jgi:hypothetical protein
VIKPKSKGSNFGKTWLKPVFKKSSHNFLSVRIGLEVLSKKKN